MKEILTVKELTLYHNPHWHEFIFYNLHILFLKTLFYKATENSSIFQVLYFFSFFWGGVGVGGHAVWQVGS